LMRVSKVIVLCHSSFVIGQLSCALSFSFVISDTSLDFHGLPCNRSASGEHCTSAGRSANDKGQMTKD
jgi:hypothetical protein